MKQFLRAALEWKTSCCLLFTGAMFLYMVFLWLFNTPPELMTMASLLLVSVLASFIQFLAFTEYIIKRMRYSLRLVLFEVLFLPALTASAVLYQWFPTNRPGSWLTFLGIFLAFFLVFTAGFELYYHIAGQKYDGILGQYKKQREEQNQ